jgi:molybdopterin converting factor subunit 1
MKIRLRLFAVLRDLAGTDERLLELAEGSTALDVWSDLRGSHPELGAYDRPPMTAINMSYSDPSTPLRDGDELAFIPPVSGG